MNFPSNLLGRDERTEYFARPYRDIDSSKKLAQAALHLEVHYEAAIRDLFPTIEKAKKTNPGLKPIKWGQLESRIVMYWTGGKLSAVCTILEQQVLWFKKPSEYFVGSWITDKDPYQHLEGGRKSDYFGSVNYTELDDQGRSLRVRGEENFDYITRPEIDGKERCQNFRREDLAQRSPDKNRARI